MLDGVIRLDSVSDWSHSHWFCGMPDLLFILKIPHIWKETKYDQVGLGEKKNKTKHEKEPSSYAWAVLFVIPLH